jgi:hypothetical protein
MTQNFFSSGTFKFFVATITCVEMLAACTGKSDAANKLAQAKVIIEHNATDNDTGFQVFVDADGWEKMELIGPNGPVAEFLPKGTVNELGMTELFLETVEPENVKMPLSELLKKMPTGAYEFRATASRLSGNRGVVSGVAMLSHKIPAGVELLSPKANAVIPVASTTVSWKGRGKAIDGTDVNIIAYQLIIEKDEEPHARMIGKKGLQMYLPVTTQSIDIPAAFFEPDTEYKWEVLAIENSGNQTLQSGAFKTQ